MTAQNDLLIQGSYFAQKINKEEEEEEVEVRELRAQQPILHTYKLQVCQEEEEEGRQRVLIRHQAAIDCPTRDAAALYQHSLLFICQYVAYVDKLAINGSSIGNWLPVIIQVVYIVKLDIQGVCDSSLFNRRRPSTLDNLKFRLFLLIRC